uniref:Uncharacterized protein n=1 Tax=Panagrolaimus sp. PS1159 TaxID=55785 RepID=A0AC35FEJ3_9BILA
MKPHMLLFLQKKPLNFFAISENAAASARDGVYNGLSATGQAIGNTVHGIKEGASNMVNGAEDALGNRLINAGQAIKND